MSYSTASSASGNPTLGEHLPTPDFNAPAFDVWTDADLFGPGGFPQNLEVDEWYVALSI